MKQLKEWEDLVKRSNALKQWRRSWYNDHYKKPERKIIAGDYYEWMAYHQFKTPFCYCTRDDIIAKDHFDELDSFNGLLMFFERAVDLLLEPMHKRMQELTDYFLSFNQTTLDEFMTYESEFMGAEVC